MVYSFHYLHSRPRNASLDEAALHILNIISQELQRPGGFTTNQKREVKNALKNLYTIAKSEGGKETHKIKQLLISIDKIKALDVVKKIESFPFIKKNVENNVQAPPIEKQQKELIDKPKDTQLQNLLQDLIDKKATKEKITQEIANLLLSIGDSVDKEILADNMPSELLLPYLADMPLTIKEALKNKINSIKILNFVQDFIANQNYDQNRDNVLKEIAKFFEEPKMEVFRGNYVKAFSALLPYFRKDNQKIVLIRMLSRNTGR